MNVTACATRGVLGVVGVLLTALLSPLWGVIGGVALTVMSVRSGRDTGAGPQGGWSAVTGLLLTIAGVAILGFAGSWTDLESLRHIATDHPASFATRITIAPELSLAAGILLVVGLMAAGGLRPFPIASSSPARGASSQKAIATALEILPPLAALIALVRIVSLSLVLHDVRVETVLISMTIVGWGMALLRTFDRKERPLGTDLLSLASLMWLTGACVLAWETGAAAQAGRSGIPGTLPGVWFCVVSDVLAWIILHGTTSTGSGAASSRLVEGMTWLRRLSLLALAGMPPFPAFWGRLWIFTALMFAHPIEPMTDLPDVHYGLMVVAVVALFGLWAAIRASLDELRFESPLAGNRGSTGLRVQFAMVLAVFLLLLTMGLAPQLLRETMVSLL